MKKLFALCFILLLISFLAAEFVSYKCQPVKTEQHFLHPSMIPDTLYVDTITHDTVPAKNTFRINGVLFFYHDKK
jgi:hypothetical protein